MQLLLPILKLNKSVNLINQIIFKVLDVTIKNSKTIS
jgi:hypothetical protein